MIAQGAQKKKKLGGFGRLSVVFTWDVGLCFFGLFCTVLDVVARHFLTPPARCQHSHDANNPQVPGWVAGAIVSPNGGLKAAPSPPQKQNSEHKAKRGGLNGLLVYVDVRIGLTLCAVVAVFVTDLICFPEEKKKSPLKKKCPQKKCFAKTPHKGVIRGN
jgi:hypothetical protein